MSQLIYQQKFSFLFVTVIFFIASCSTSGPGLFSKKTPHQQYGDKISNAGLNQTALGQLWFSAANGALSRPLTVSLPYSETGYFPADNPQAVGLKFAAKRGEKLQITLEKKPANGFLIYMDLWDAATDRTSPKFLTSSDTIGSPIQYETGKEEFFILRLQPELLKAGEYTINITTGPSLAFPVPSNAKATVQSFWGAGRDNGSRKHEGIDIFAPFRTPVVAAADGAVTRVEETGIGGKVIWLRPENRAFTLYYAHLDSQLAKAGETVRAGDTLGLIGNTGNARTTSPHLHFGIYAIGGAVDPFPFVNTARKDPVAISAALSALGRKLRTSRPARIYPDANTESGSFIQLDKETLIIVKAATKNWYKVMLPSGEEGFINGAATTDLNKPIKKITLKAKTPLLDQPDSLAPRKLIMEPGKSINILAAHATFYYIDTDDFEGWMLKAAL